MSGDERHDPRFDELLPAYAAGALTESECREVEAHLDVCPACRSELAAWREATVALAEQVEAEPPAGVRAELMRRVEEDAEEDAAARERSTGSADRAALDRDEPGRRLLAAAAAFFLLVAAGAVTWGLHQRTRLEGELAQTRSHAAALEQDLDGLRKRLKATRIRLSQVSSTLSLIAATPPGGEVKLAGLGSAAAGRGRLFVDPDRRHGLFVAGGLPKLPKDRVYQLWTIAGGTPRSAGVFRSDDRGTGLLLLDEPPPSVDVWAVTVEPAPGVQQPTGEMVLKS
jgi:anti-sigma-K factor RskA